MGFSLGALGGVIGGLGTMGIGTALSLGNAASSAYAANRAYAGQKAANETNIELAKENRDWQEKMSNTAHQREVSDLRMAGLNPILSGTGGAGSSTPAGSVAQVQNPHGQTIAGVSALFNSAMSIVQTLADAQNKMAQKVTEDQRPQLIMNQADEAIASAGLKRSQINEVGANTDLLEQKIETEKIQQLKIRAEEALLSQQKLSEPLKRAILSNDAKIQEKALKEAVNEGQIDDTTFGLWMRYLGRLTGTIGKVFSGHVGVKK
ncbi:MAG: DNA pilot protein [Microviridae sp.]|nr:MAG: DNA pilot protein [Microviridae sp.]